MVFSVCLIVRAREQCLCFIWLLICLSMYRCCLIVGWCYVVCLCVIARSLVSYYVLCVCISGYSSCCMSSIAITEHLALEDVSEFRAMFLRLVLKHGSLHGTMSGLSMHSFCQWVIGLTCSQYEEAARCGLAAARGGLAPGVAGWARRVCDCFTRLGRCPTLGKCNRDAPRRDARR